MSFNFKQCNQNEIKNIIQEYVSTLSSPIDSFLENHIINSAFYKISFNSEVAGYYGVHDNQLLTQFYLKLVHCNKSQEIFKQVIEKHSIKSIFVPTSDELFLSLVLDNDYKVNKQAYFFQDSKVEIPKEKLYRDGELNFAIPSDIPKITDVCQDFINKIDERIENREIFTFTKDNILLGIGIVEQSKLLEGYASIGMFTNEKYRKQGIGRTILHYLKEWCYLNQINPICGCWYYNTLSKQTIESANMISKTRLLNFTVQ
ncbi:GNAT family N-acetyltransferase [Gottfriedia acidiceleris]|uniref:GNAT family N-acetyltransferase n=1 Tax=Gottfriedia acidiceleris TaxID=371036 RepID=UPI00101C81F5|nr:GNAT family N-acetyltransferase [Gottfriedia acidiceleris]